MGSDDGRKTSANRHRDRSLRLVNPIPHDDTFRQKPGPNPAIRGRDVVATVRIRHRRD
jgi:hypothetical protein